MMKTAAVFVLSLILVNQAHSEQVIARLNVTGLRNFPTVLLTPLAIRNPDTKKWLVIWNTQQNTAEQAYTVFGRFVDDYGNMHNAKQLVKNTNMTDAQYDPIEKTFLLLLNRPGLTLYSQVLTANLARKGPAQDLTNVFSMGNSFIGNLRFSPDDGTFDLYGLWEGSCQPPKCDERVYVYKLDHDGKPVTSPKFLFGTRNGRQFVNLQAARNPATNDTLLLLEDLPVFASTSVPDSVFVYVAKPNGGLVSRKPLVADSVETCPQNTVDAAAAFNDVGMGFIALSELPCDQSAHHLKFRWLKRSETSLSSQKSIFDDAYHFSQILITYYDKLRKEFVLIWTEDRALQTMRVDSTGKVLSSPFTLATANLGDILSASASYDERSGKTLVTWVEMSGNFNSTQIRALIFKP